MPDETRRGSEVKLDRDSEVHSDPFSFYGGWAVLYGARAISTTQLRLAIDEDWYLDSERRHTTEQVGYIVFE